MQKMMFNDRYGLTNAVLDGTKTTTRRLEKCIQYIPTDLKIVRVDIYGYDAEGEPRYCEAVTEDKQGNWTWYKFRPYIPMNEEVAVAMSYRTIYNKNLGDLHPRLIGQWLPKLVSIVGKEPEKCMGWGNKQSVRPDLMPYRIFIDNIRLEHLQDITDEDCMREGIKEYPVGSGCGSYYGYFDHKTNTTYLSETPRQAYAELIDKISGKGTWESNPLVLVYDFHSLGKVDKFTL